MDANGIEAAETIPASRKLGRDEAAEILAASSKVVVAMRSKVDTFETGGKVDDEVLDHFLGRTGNMRAPTARVGDVTLIGFNEDAWAGVLL